eukprot:UN03606
MGASHSRKAVPVLWAASGLVPEQVHFYHRSFYGISKRPGGSGFSSHRVIWSHCLESLKILRANISLLSVILLSVIGFVSYGIMWSFIRIICNHIYVLLNRFGIYLTYIDSLRNVGTDLDLLQILKLVLAVIKRSIVLWSLPYGFPVRWWRYDVFG